MLEVKIKISKDEVVKLFAFINTCMVSCNITGLPGADVVGGVIQKVLRASHDELKKQRKQEKNHGKVPV